MNYMKLPIEFAVFRYDICLRKEMKSIFMRRLFRVILAFLFGSQAYAQKNQKDETSILFVGNSYTHMNEMPFIFDKIAKAKGKSVHVEMNTRSGSSFNIHTTRPDLFETIKSRKWDFIVLQGYSRELTFEPNYLDTATMPYIRQIIDSIRANNACTNILLHMTWGYKEGFIERPETDSYEKMSDIIADGYQYLSDSLDLPIVPVGKVWRAVRETHPDIELYDADLAHPSIRGSYLSACTFFAAIFKESPEGAVTSTIAIENAERIQKIAGDFVLKNFERYKLNKNFYKIEWKTTSAGKYMLTGVTNFEKAKSVAWDFGDGAKSTAKTVSHEYKKAGKYKLKLTIQDECGVRVIYKDIKIKAPKKPKKKPTVTPKKGNKAKKKS